MARNPSLQPLPDGLRMANSEGWEQNGDEWIAEIGAEKVTRFSLALHYALGSQRFLNHAHNIHGTHWIDR
jgi:hypothetical protein